MFVIGDRRLRDAGSLGKLGLGEACALAELPNELVEGNNRHTRKYMCGTSR